MNCFSLHTICLSSYTLKLGYSNLGIICVFSPVEVVSVPSNFVVMGIGMIRAAVACVVAFHICISITANVH